MRAWRIFACFAVLSAANAAERIVTAGSGVTESVFALGCGGEVVGVDLSSIYPEEIERLPKVGYFRQLTAEGVLSLTPTLLLCTEDAGPPAALAQIERAGVRVVRLPVDHTPEGALERILGIGEALEVPEEARNFVDGMKREIEATTSLQNGDEERPVVLFVMSHGGGTPNVSGVGTAAHAMIELAGGRNAITGYEGYKPLTAESALVAEPEIILTTDRSLGAIGGVEALLKWPGLSRTPAGRDRRVVVMDDVLLLNFGPRLGEALQLLHAHLHAPPKGRAHASVLSR